MRIEIYPTAAGAGNAVICKLLTQVGQHPRSVLGLATGGTMEPIYKGLIAAYRSGATSFAGCTSFNLDEYIGLRPDDPRSYRAYMNSKFFDHVDLPLAQRYLPRTDLDPGIAAVRYETLIRKLGPIDLQLLGIGKNGHIGFNEPMTPFTTVTHATDLCRTTIEANARYFDHETEVPRRAITMGIATILSARSIVLLATGKEKAAAISSAINGPVTEGCPASALGEHEDITFVLDSEASLALDRLNVQLSH